MEQVSGGRWGWGGGIKSVVQNTLSVFDVFFKECIPVALVEI